MFVAKPFVDLRAVSNGREISMGDVRTGNILRKFMGTVWVFAALPWFVLPAVAQERSADSSSGVAALWADGVEKIAHGDFDQARESLARILDSRPGEESYGRVAGWLDRRLQADSTRSELQAQQREQYLRLAKKRLAKEEWLESLVYIRSAMICSLAESIFLSEAWVQQVRDKVVSLAQEHVQKREWSDAAGLYYELKAVFEGNAEYENKFEECISHSRLEAIYSEESKWKSRLEGITPDLVGEALWRIHLKYAVEPEFKKSARIGLKRLKLLAESDALVKLFPSIEDEGNRRQYLRRLDGLLRRIERKPEYDYKAVEETFSTAMKINDQTIRLDRELIIYEFLEGMLDSSGSLDKFTSMIWPAELSDFDKHTQGHFPGVGIHITRRDGVLTVVSPLEDTPAYEAGIEADDQITHVDGESTEDLTLNGAVQTITGPPGTTVRLTIRRPRTKKSFDVTLTRKDIQIFSVKGYQRDPETRKWDYMLDPEFGIAYIRVTSFSGNTTSGLREALKEIEAKKAQGLILDLRFNPGGLLRAAIEMSEIFLPHDSVIVSTEGRHSDAYSRSSRSRGRYCKLPMVVLVNEQSASASEIVSGALKDHNRAVVVGQRSFGKGSVQNLIPLGHGDARLKLTTAQYYLPSGKSIHRLPGSETWGVEPDIVVDLVPRERDQIRSMNRQAEVIRSDEPAAVEENAASDTEEQEADPKPADEKESGSDENPTGDDAQDAEERVPGDGTDSKPASDDEVEEDDESEAFIEYPAIDYQLETAALVLRVQLLERLGFGILPAIKLGQNAAAASERAVVAN